MTVLAIFQVQSLLLLLITLALLIFEILAFLDVLKRRPEAFVVADKLTKPAWLIILGIALAAHLLLLNSPFHLLNLIGAVAAIVYVVDARPAMRELTGR